MQLHVVPVKRDRLEIRLAGRLEHSLSYMAPFSSAGILHHPLVSGKAYWTELALLAAEGHLRKVELFTRLRDVGATVGMPEDTDLLLVVKRLPFMVRVPFVLAPGQLQHLFPKT